MEKLRDLSIILLVRGLFFFFFCFCFYFPAPKRQLEYSDAKQTFHNNVNKPKIWYRFIFIHIYRHTHTHTHTHFHQQAEHLLWVHPCVSERPGVSGVYLSQRSQEELSVSALRSNRMSARIQKNKPSFCSIQRSWLFYSIRRIVQDVLRS